MYRLFSELAINSRDADDGNLDDVLYVAKCTATRFYDEKLPEDCHQRIRDLGRRRRSKTAGLTSAFDSLIRSRLIDDRGVTAPHVSDQAVARRTWSTMRREVATEREAERREDPYYSGLNKILDPTRDWPSPTVKTLFRSAMASRWIETHVAAMEAEVKDLPPDAAWWSRLFVQHRVARLTETDEMYLVLNVSHWGVLLVPCLAVRDGGYHLDAVSDNWRLEHITHGSWELAVPTPFMDPGVGICFTLGSWDPLLKLGLLQRYNFQAWELSYVIDYLFDVEAGSLARWTFAQRLTAVIETVFSGPEVEAEKDRVVESYQRAKADSDSDVDEDFEALLQDLCHVDHSNAQDMKNMQSKKKRKSDAELLERRRVDRAARRATSASKTARKDKAAARKKAAADRKTARAIADGERRMKRSRRNIDSAAATPGDVLPPPPAIAGGSPSASLAGEAPPPPQPPPPAAPPPPRPPLVQAPLAGGGWQVLPVAGGWIRWHPDKQRCDAHCALHPLCRNNRVCKFGPLGLQLAWLRLGIDNPGISEADHKLQKEVLSAADALDVRRACRISFLELANVLGRTSPEARLLWMERTARDGVDREPAELPCRSLTVALMQEATSGAFVA